MFSTCLSSNEVFHCGYSSDFLSEVLHLPDISSISPQIINIYQVWIQDLWSSVLEDWRHISSIVIPESFLYQSPIPKLVVLTPFYSFFSSQSLKLIKADHVVLLLLYKCKNLSDPGFLSIWSQTCLFKCKDEIRYLKHMRGRFLSECYLYKQNLKAVSHQNQFPKS